jgi:hypothetical protein
MPDWTNAPLALFHGTDSSAMSDHDIRVGHLVPGFRVDLRHCRSSTDFGRGFYTTTSEHQARNWANITVQRRRGARASRAVLLRFSVDRNWLASLDALCFNLPSRDFFDLVKYCRSGGDPHRRGVRRRTYDVVYGPVTLWPQTMVVERTDQVSFHSDRAAMGLGRPSVRDLAELPTGLFEISV